MQSVLHCLVAAAAALAAGATPAAAQFAPVGPAPTSPGASPAYGYQNYDSSNPRGFYHPNDMGYGTYMNPTKLKGHRSPALNYRRFRGY